MTRSRSDLLVWLALPRWRVMSQLVARTLTRRLRRIELWNGNFESPLWTVFTDRDHPCRETWRTHARTHNRVRNGLTAPDGPVVVRLRSRRDVRSWLSGPVQIAAQASR